MPINKNDELVLVVPSNIIFEKGKWQGLQTSNLDYYVDIVKKYGEFKRRGDVENDANFQQIIPYIMFNFRENYFMYRYLPRAGEKRLVNTYQIGVGGHINPIDGDKTTALENAMMREWDEEVNFTGNIVSKKLIGIINDDGSPVEAVHLGFVYNFTGDSGEIAVKETTKIAGEMVNREDIRDKVEKSPESVWMGIMYRDFLAKL